MMSEFENMIHIMEATNRGFKSMLRVMEVTNRAMRDAQSRYDNMTPPDPVATCAACGATVDDDDDHRCWHCNKHFCCEHLFDLWGDQVCEKCCGEDAAEILDRQADMLRRAETAEQTRAGLELIKTAVEQMLLTLKKGE